MALLLGVLTGLIWPLVMRIALPVALFTFGLGSFLLLGALVLALSFAIPGVVDRQPRRSPWSSRSPSPPSRAWSAALLAIDEDELFFRRARRKARAGRDCRRPAAGGAVPADRRAVLRHRAPRRPRRLHAHARRLAARGQPHPDDVAHRLELADRRRGERHPARHQPRHPRLPLVRQGARPRLPGVLAPRTPPRSSAASPTAAACSPAAGPAAATCSPATPRTSA